MNIDDVKLNTMTLEELEKVQELLDERIGIIKGRASFKTEKTYSTQEAKQYLQECLKE